MGGFATKGYSLSELSRLFREKETVIRHWIKRGLFGGKVGTGARIPERNVAAFLVRFPTAYDLNRVHQVWLRAMVFCGVGCVSPFLGRSGVPGGGDSLFLRRRRRSQRPSLPGNIDGIAERRSRRAREE
jgi:hypothetical protein